MVKIPLNAIKTELFSDCGIGSGSFILCCFSILLSRKMQRQIVAVCGSDGSQKETAPDYFFFLLIIFPVHSSATALVLISSFLI